MAQLIKWMRFGVEAIVGLFLTKENKMAAKKKAKKKATKKKATKKKAKKK